MALAAPIICDLGNDISVWKHYKTSRSAEYDVNVSVQRVTVDSKQPVLSYSLIRWVAQSFVI